MDFNHYYGIQNCYNFENTGNRGEDACGVKDGTIVGSVTFEAGKIGTAARFPGTDNNSIAGPDRRFRSLRDVPADD